MNFEVYADSKVGGIRESHEVPDGAVIYADIDEARRVLKLRLAQAGRVAREQAAWAPPQQT